MRSPEEILEGTRTIAVVGASPKEWRPSHFVMRYLLEHGYRCIPVRPRSERPRGQGPRGLLAASQASASCDEVLGVPCASSLLEIAGPIDLVDVFRRSEQCPEVARDAVAAGAKALWLQSGIVSAEARQLAESAGLDYVEDRCTMVVHRRMSADGGKPRGSPPSHDRGAQI